MQSCMKIMRNWQRSDSKFQQFGVLLFDMFSNHCLANAIEPLRAVNMLLGYQAFEWSFLSPDGKPVCSSSGLPVTVESSLSESGSGDILFLMPSYGFRSYVTPANNRALRAASKRYDVVAAMDMGSYLMASAGLLAGHQATIHWDELDNFHEAFPEIDVVRKRVVFDGSRWSCGGAMTTFDLVLRMIGDTYGEALRLEVAALFMHGESGTGGGAPTARSQLVTAALAIMRENIEEPLTISKIALRLGIGIRKLGQLCQSELGAGPQKVYCRIRLLSAQRYVEQTGLSIFEIALRCGYENPSAMTRAFRAEFGITPQQQRCKTGN